VKRYSRQLSDELPVVRERPSGPAFDWDVLMLILSLLYIPDGASSTVFYFYISTSTPSFDPINHTWEQDHPGPVYPDQGKATPNFTSPFTISYCRHDGKYGSIGTKHKKKFKGVFVQNRKGSVVTHNHVGLAVPRDGYTCELFPTPRLWFCGLLSGRARRHDPCEIVYTRNQEQGDYSYACLAPLGRGTTLR
jgi:hypothetical protein